MRTNCKDCEFSTLALAGPQAKQSGLSCRRNPPVPHALATPTPQGLAVQVLSLWPIVQASDWCGEGNPIAPLLKPN